MREMSGYATLTRPTRLRKIIMGTTEIMKKAPCLKASERYELLEMLHKSLDKPDSEIDNVWIEEAERRLQAYREGRLDVVTMEEDFRDL